MHEAIAKIKAQTDQGISAVRGRRTDIASQYFNKALELAEDLQDDRVRRDEMSSLSMVFDQCGFPDLALTAAEEAVDLDRKLRLDAELYEDILNVGNAHQNLGNADKAEACFREALEFCLKRGDWANAASANTNIGNIFAQKGDMKKAIPIFEKSLEYLAKEAFDNTEMNTRAMLLQASEMEQYDVDRSIENARQLCERFWQDLPPGHREALGGFVAQAAERYLKGRPQKNPAAWKAKTFPMIFR